MIAFDLKRTLAAPLCTDATNLELAMNAARSCGPPCAKQPQLLKVVERQGGRHIHSQFVDLANRSSTGPGGLDRDPAEDRARCT